MGYTDWYAHTGRCVSYRGQPVGVYTYYIVHEVQPCIGGGRGEKGVQFPGEGGQRTGIEESHDWCAGSHQGPPTGIPNFTGGDQKVRGEKGVGEEEQQKGGRGRLTGKEERRSEKVVGHHTEWRR